MNAPSSSRIGHRILEHVRALAYPRFAGTAGEERARSHIRGAFAASGYRVVEQEFSASLVPLEVLPRLGAAMLTAMLVGAYAFIDGIPLFAVELAVLATLALTVSSRWWPVLERAHRLRRFGRVRSSNIIARHVHEGELVNVVFLAHYDSKHQLLGGATRLVLQNTLAALTVVTALLTIVAAVTGWPRELLLPTLLPAALIGLVLQVNGTTNASVGSFDNASGVGVLLELAAAYADEVPSCNVTFIATGAQEVGCSGAVALASSEWFHREYPASRTVMINLDSVGSRAPLRVVNRFGLPPTRSGALVTDLCLRISERFGMEARPAWLPTGASADHLPFAMRGYQAVTLSTAGWDAATRTIHTTRDTEEVLDAGALEECYAVCLEVLDSIPHAALRPTTTLP